MFYSFFVGLNLLSIAKLSRSSDSLTDFEALRTALMNSYSAQTTAHVGYIITVGIGIAALFYEKDRISKRFFYIALSILSSLMLYFFFRTIFWAWMGNEVLLVTPQQAIDMHKATVIFGIQEYLVKTFSEYSSALFTPSGIASFLYKIGSVLSLSILFAISWFGIFLYEFIRLKRKRLKARYFFFSLLVRLEALGKKLHRS